MSGLNTCKLRHLYIAIDESRVAIFLFNNNIIGSRLSLSYIIYKKLIF